VQSETLILACIAAFYPLGLLAIGILLATDRPLTLGLSFLGGAATSLFVIGVLVITVLHAAGLTREDATTARTWVRIGLGIALVILGTRFRTALPAHKPAARGDPSAWQARLRRARPATVFLTGAVL
jgi:hypothetical protein